MASKSLSPGSLPTILCCLRTMYRFNPRQIRDASTPFLFETNSSPFYKGRIVSGRPYSDFPCFSRNSKNYLLTTVRHRSEPVTIKQRRHEAPYSTQNDSSSSSKSPPISKQDEDFFQPTTNTKQKEPWQVQKKALQSKFKEGWSPRKRLSPDEMENIRQLNRMDPFKFNTPVLAEQFKISREAIRRILKSSWRPTEKEAEKRKKRWEKRSERIWDHMAEVGLRPQRDFTKKSEAQVADQGSKGSKESEGNEPV